MEIVDEDEDVVPMEIDIGDVMDIEERLLGLPLELQIKIVVESGLHVSDLLSLCAASKRLSNICQYDIVWQYMVHRDLGKDVVQRPGETWKATYKRLIIDPVDRFWTRLSNNLINLNEKNQLRWFPQRKLIPKSEREQIILETGFFNSYKFVCRRINQDGSVESSKVSGRMQPRRWSLSMLIKQGLRACHTTRVNRRIRLHKDDKNRMIVYDTVEV